MSAFFLTILNMSISASWIVLAVLILRLLLKKAPKWITVLLWGIVAVRLICPLSIESVLSLIPSAETINPDILVEQAPVVQPDFPVIDGVENPGIIGGGSPVIGDDPIIGGDPVTGEPSAPTVDTPVKPLQIVISVSSYVWLAGMAGMLAYTLISYFRVKRRIGAAIRLRENIYQSESVVSPFVLGLIKPKIYLPFGMDGQDMEYVIAHENAHLRRKDHWWKPVGFLILTLHWFNPLLWLGYVLLSRDIELACDEKVIKELNFQEKADYSQALLNCSVNRRIIAACPLAFGEVGVKDRVKSVLNYKKPAFWIIVVAIVASIVTAVCFLTDPVRDEISDDPTQQTDPSDATEGTEPSDTTDKKTPTTDAYNAFLDGYVTDTSVLYFTKDIDNNGTEELFIRQNTAIEVYTYENVVKKVGTHDFVTGTLLLHHTNDNKYPGIVYVTVGGGKNHFGYITITNGALTVQQTFDDDYGMISGEKEDVFYTQDENLIALCKKVYEISNRIGYSVWESKITENPYAIREITDERVVKSGDKKLFNNGQFTLRFPTSWKCFTASGEDNVVYYFQDSVMGEKCQLSVDVTFSAYRYDRTWDQYMEYLSASYEDVVIESLATETIRGYACTKVVYSYTEDNTKFIGVWYDNLIEGLRLYDFRITYPAKEKETYETVFAYVLESIQFITADNGSISSLPLKEAYDYAVKMYVAGPSSKYRDVGDLQLETGQIIEIDGKYYQSFVASNVDIRYIWISRSEFPDNKTALWDWYPVGSAQVSSLDLLGKIDEGRSGNETDKIDPADIGLLSVVYNNSPFITQKGTTVSLKEYKPFYKRPEETTYYETGNVFVPRDYTFVDLDKDGKKELIVAEAPYADTYLILREENGKIYGYSLPNRWFQSLKKDGSFQSSGGALIHDYNTISFNQNTYQISTIAKFYFEGDAKKPVADKYGYAPDYEKSVFEINGKPVSYEEIQQFAEEWDNRPGAVWIKVT